ncbi:hypothetical protein CTheo_5090 [Ceratobasidium theobromae]|uniref:Uncharacterized protein n=1 Tax=Ceratobasidium theobromae TaxID=1582974 RepID=A0A5N5QJ52_9AGAM|nr:hypothetical protein CTheo_5090 [Ceratobasidium theobromae]
MLVRRNRPQSVECRLCSAPILHGCYGCSQGSKLRDVNCQTERLAGSNTGLGVAFSRPQIGARTLGGPCGASRDAGCLKAAGSGRLARCGTGRRPPHLAYTLPVMLAALRIPRSNLGIDAEQPRPAQALPSPTDATSPVPSLSRSILSASDSSPNGWVTLELPRTASPANSPSGSSGRSDGDECAHVRFQDICVIIPDNPIKSPGLAARMLSVGAWSSKRRVSDPEREHSLLGVRLPGLGRKHKHVPCESPPPCAPLPLRPCLVHRSSSQPSASSPLSPQFAPIGPSRSRLSTPHSTSHNESSSLPSVLVRAPTRSNSMPPPSSFVTIPLRECCTKCAPACAQLDSEVHWSPGARRKLREDRAEREREARSGLRDPTSNTSYGWEDMLNLGDSDMEDKGGAVGSSSKPSGSFQRRTASPPPSSLATRRALKNPLALPCPLPRACTEDDTDEESLFPLPASPRGARSPASRCSKSPAKLSPNNSTTPSPSATGELSTKCADAPDPAKCAEVIAVKCAEKAKIEVVVPAVRRLLEQRAFQGHRLSPVPGSEEPTPRCGTPTLPGLELENKPEPCPKEERGRCQITKLEMAQVDRLPPQRMSSPPVSGLETRPGPGRRRSSSAGSVGRTLGAIVRGVAAGVVGGPSVHM